jgi:transketolase
MRKAFAQLLLEEMKVNKNIYIITGDLGYGLWDDIKNQYPDRFINPGSSEQLMIGMAVGLALEGKIPVVYSITPFLLYRPFEIIRNYLNYEGIPVKLVGGGRNKDYIKLGYTHWAEEDKQIMQILHNIKSSYPENNLQIEEMFPSFIYSPNPEYINLVK